MAGRDRKNSLKALFGEPMPPAPEIKSVPDPIVSKSGEGDGDAASSPPPVPAPEAAARPAPPAAPRAASGAVKAMGLSLGSITREAEEARALRQALEEGERIVSLETDRIDGSFVSDRLSKGATDDPDFETLVESIRESGQQVPILVRPHPEKTGRFQVAYGHRRLQASVRLGQPVKAIVRALSDDDLVLAQGKENAERRNLSFIERALFAAALVERGFDRKLIGEALAVQKSELSRLLQVADSVPHHFARAIGPAPKTGRERWMALGEVFTKGGEGALAKAYQETDSAPFLKADTDQRFKMLFDRLNRRWVRPKPADETILGADGMLLARINRKGKAAKIEFVADTDPEFIEAISKLIVEEHARFAKAKGQ
ncbi:plasmid partitioning protein RepB [Rhizobium halophytocola]|uniref:ParB family chromosome partitioning protein n=1 Tax=Rhizobium halophytocola TaxID=735519 RepID=A0ABS4DVB4_9HYPH|nr:plasmid partitioning protein RepB [Rhizobium halophytocola]MBP1849574.1 ParB family chromosome partitioning protein [Rhizobium halophytocola]